MANPLETFLSGANIEFIEGLYARFLEDPESVDTSWRDLFAAQARQGSGKPIYVTEKASFTPAAAPSKNGKSNGAGLGLATQTMSVSQPGAMVAREGVDAVVAARPVGGDDSSQVGMGLQARVDQTVYAFRLRGHLLATLDPLGRPRPPLEHAADLGMVSASHFSAEELDQQVDAHSAVPQDRVKLRDLLEHLRRTYCGNVGVEFMTLLDSDRRRWLMPRMEHVANRVEPTVEGQRRILTELSYAEGFESFLHTKYQGVKRFSIDGGESLLPMLQTMLEEGGELGVREVVIGMAHRGRLNVLTNIMGKSLTQIFSEFNGPSDPEHYVNRGGDVKYHMGFSSDHVTSLGKKIHLSLAFNPSHLEFVDPVVEGRVRAKQERKGEAGRIAILPLLIHGDAAMAGQGVVPETLNLSRLGGYDTGGTLHIVINNQLGYTTDPEDARSSIYCTAVAQMLDIPIFHVNGDDPEACVHVMRLATQYRQLFQSDVVIDLICFRRYGHNEGDEPAYTQPQMYELIRKHATVRQLYAEDLARRNRIQLDEAERIKADCQQRMLDAHTQAKQTPQLKEPSALEGLWRSYQGGADSEAPVIFTGVAKTRLQALLHKLASVPEGFTPLPKIQDIVIKRRQDMAEGKLLLDWSAAENLAYASLLTEGWHVRLTGQDTERGTFAHRMAVLHDAHTGRRYTSLANLAPDQAPFAIFNSPLSETGCLGFEYGYSLDYPDALVAWEAQFGDFVNGAQVIIDQFLVAGERKWKRLSGLTLLLPHGYEGAGPEHSNARIERFLELAAEDNIQVVYPTTPAQMFHLLRRQVLRPYRKPLVVMTPKSLLRLNLSTLEELATGGFQRVLPDKKELDLQKVTRLLLCSGKLFYDLGKARDESKDDTVAVIRVEQLYPFPHAELAKLLASMPALRELFWVQEEPKNMGAWRFVFPLLTEAVNTARKQVTVGYVGRVESASPATGFAKAHELEQKLIVNEALSRGAQHGR